MCARFPGLTVAFLEGNCSWAPWLLWRLDEHWEMSAAYDHPDLTIAPSAYFRRQCYLSVDCDEAPAEVVTRYGLEDRIVFSTDYPHEVDAETCKHELTRNTPRRWTGFCKCPWPSRPNASSCGTTALSSTGWRGKGLDINCGIL